MSNRKVFPDMFLEVGVRHAQADGKGQRKDHRHHGPKARPAVRSHHPGCGQDCGRSKDPLTRACARNPARTRNGRAGGLHSIVTTGDYESMLADDRETAKKIEYERDYEPEYEWET